MSSIGQASIYKFIKEKKFLIHSLSKVKMGASIASAPYIWLEEDAPPKVFVDALLYALSEAKEGLPNPENWASFSKDFIAAIGLKKQSDLYKQSISINVLKKEDVIIFTPTSNNRSKGFVNIVPVVKIEVGTNQSVEEIASSLKIAFESCE